MEVLKIETLTSSKSLLVHADTSETTDITKDDNDDFFVNEIDEGDEIHLRLSDDEEFEQDHISEHAEILKTRVQLERDDFKVEESKRSHSKIRQNLSRIKTVISATEDESSGNSSLDEKVADETCDIYDNETTMSGSERIPPLLHNSPKYWSSSHDKRWKGVNSSQDRGFPHRKSSDWFNKHSEKDKFQKKNNFNGHHKNHFHNKIRNNTRENYNDQSRDNSSRRSKPEDINESKKNKNISNSSEKSTLVNGSIKENGISEDSCLKENGISEDSYLKENGISEDSYLKENGISEDSHLKENNIVEKSENIVTDEIDKSKLISEEKNNESVPDTNLSSEEKTKEKDTSENDEKSSDQNNDGNVVSKSKDCDVSNELDEEQCESKVEKNGEITEEIEKKLKNEGNGSLIGKESLDNEDCPDINNLTESTKEITDTSLDISKAENYIISMETSEEAPNLVQENFENSGDNLQSVSSNERDSKTLKCDEMKNEKSRLNDGQLENESINQQNQLENDSNEKDAELSLHENEDSNHSVRSEKSIDISEMDISEQDIEPVNKEKKVDISADINKESMDIGNDDESSGAFSLAVTESQKSESNDSTDLENDEAKVDDESSKQNEITLQEKSNKLVDTQEKSATIEEVDLIEDEADTEECTKDDAKKNNQDQKIDLKNNAQNNTKSLSVSNEKTNEESSVVHKKRRRKRENCIQENLANDILMENGIRQKRRSAKNAEEMIRKGILKNDEEDDDSNDSNKLVSVSYKKTNLVEAESSPSLKRTIDDVDSVTEDNHAKKKKTTEDAATTFNRVVQDKKNYVESKEKRIEMSELVKNISQEDIRRKLKNMTKKEVEAILLQKIVECIAVRGEMGKLREQARNSQRNLEATRTKCQQLQKQIEGFDMVIKRIGYDKTNNSDKYVQPIKINRSVGLQVNFVADQGILNLKQMQMFKSGASNTSSPKACSTTSANSGSDNRSVAQSPRKMVKTRSPRRTEIPGPPSLHPIISTNTTATTTSSTPASTVNKSVDASSKRFSLPSSINVGKVVPQQTVVVNSNVNINGGVARPATTIIQRSNATPSNKSSDLIDLTDEEEKTKAPTLTTPTIITNGVPRVLKAVPTNVTLNNSTNLRLVQTSNAGSPTSIVNNLNNSAVYVMHNGMVQQRQIILKTANGIRPGTPGNARNISTISYKQGVQTLNGVRVVPNSANLQQISRHPAPLPETHQIIATNPQWKLPPPAPSLKINKVATGIVLSWNMTLSDKFAKIISYQLFAYQEISGTPPNTSQWKKVGDVAALPLPMACTLTQFTEGNNYHFAVRAVDAHSRFGHYSKPGHISL